MNNTELKRRILYNFIDHATENLQVRETLKKEADIMALVQENEIEKEMQDRQMGRIIYGGR